MNLAPTSDRRFLHARRIAATPEQVFDAFAQPDRLARWWGPEGFSSTFQAFDFRAGGSWDFVMRGPDGNEYPNSNVFKTIEAPHRIEIDHISDDHHFTLDITLAAQGPHTLVTWAQTFDTAEQKQQLAPFVEPANEQNLDRLEREVTATRRNEDER